MYILFYVHPEDASEEPKYVAECCTFQNLIKVCNTIFYSPCGTAAQRGPWPPHS